VQTLEWQEQNTRTFVTLTNQQLDDLAVARGFMLPEAASLTDEQRELVARIWDVPEFVTDPACERVQWCSTAFVSSEPGYLAIVRRAPGLVVRGWLAYPDAKDWPPA
jgi:hypothetical protein